MKLLYVHGYKGQENGNAATLVRKALKNRGLSFTLDAPSFPVTEPKRMEDMLKDLLQRQGYDYAIASSLGAFYTLQQKSVNCILVNPALPDNLLKIREMAPEDNPELTDAFLNALRQRQDTFFSNQMDEKQKRGTYFIFGNQDDVAGNEAFYEKYCGGDEGWSKTHICHIDMGHKMAAAGAEKVCDILEDLCAAAPETDT